MWRAKHLAISPHSLPALGNLCPCCRTLDFARLHGDYDYSEETHDHHASLDDLLESAQLGCGICQLFRYSSEVDPQSGYDQLRAEGQIVVKCGYLGVEMEVGSLSTPSVISPNADHDNRQFRFSQPSIEGEQYFHRFCCIKIVNLERSPGYPNFNPIEPDSSSDARFAQISSWLKECYSNHKDCDTPINQILPTRVLDLGGRHDTRSIRLLTTKGRKGQWVALSHSWGDFQPLRTTKINLAAHQDNIEWIKLPQTFQDAVIIAKKLGFRYMWIDSLCIVQDSLEDWENEAATMASVYGNAALTICAEASANGQRGIFNSANKRRGLGIKIPATSPQNSSRENMWLTARPAEIDGDFHIGSRAWVMQESLLSSRLISYAADQLYFSCRTAQQGDKEGHMAYGVYDLDVYLLEQSTKVLLSGPMVYESPIGKLNESTALTTTSHPRHTVTRHQFRAKLKDRLPKFGAMAKRVGTLTGLSHLLPGAFSLKPDSNTSELLEKWYRIVESYAPRQITKIEDRLPAIAGVAKRVCALTGLSYVAGLWEEDLIHGLCWRCRPQSQPFSTYVGPSWSWISIVYPPGEKMTSMKHLYASSDVLSPASVVARDIKIEHIDIKYSTVDRFLGIKEGSSLRISGLCGASYHIIDSSTIERGRHRTWEVCTIKQQQFRLKADMLDYRESPVGRDLLFLHLASSTAVETTDGETLLLILEKSPADVERYVRVGIAVVPEHTWRQVDLACWSVQTITII